ncbi:unnamed protein product [Sphagnum troendelagicum]|uniref:Uncharacterized protein n=1 Tax=Sphagnum troendelagicum TaxID=128251 RepID=A0ABP0UT28_9BRYO
MGSWDLNTGAIVRARQLRLWHPMALFPLELLRMWVNCIDISMKSCHISVQHILPTLSLNQNHIIKAAAAAPSAHLFSMKER